MHMHRATHTITSMRITIMIAQREAALAMRMLPPALPRAPTGRRVRLVRAPRRVAARRCPCVHVCVHVCVCRNVPVGHVSARAVMLGRGRGSRHHDSSMRGSGGGGGGERGAGRRPYAAGEHAVREGKAVSR